MGQEHDQSGDEADQRDSPAPVDRQAIDLEPDVHGPRLADAELGVAGQQEHVSPHPAATVDQLLVDLGLEGRNAAEEQDRDPAQCHQPHQPDGRDEGGPGQMRQEGHGACRHADDWVAPEAALGQLGVDHELDREVPRKTDEHSLGGHGGCLR